LQCLVAATNPNSEGVRQFLLPYRRIGVRRQSNASAPPVISVREKRALNAVSPTPIPPGVRGRLLTRCPTGATRQSLHESWAGLTVGRHADERQIRKEREGHRAE